MLDTRRLSPSDLYEEEREGFGSLLVPPPSQLVQVAYGSAVPRTTANEIEKGIMVDRRSTRSPWDQTC